MDLSNKDKCPSVALRDQQNLALAAKSTQYAISTYDLTYIHAYRISAFR